MLATPIALCTQSLSAQESKSKTVPLEASPCLSSSANEPILFPVAPDSEGCECPPLITDYRGIVGAATFVCLGHPSFFTEAVEIVQRHVAETLRHLNPSAPTEEEFLRLIQVAARSFAREIEAQFVKTGILGVPAKG